MIGILANIERRKQALVARCGQERAALAASLRGLERPAALADRAVGVVRSLRAHPLLVGTVIAVVVAGIARRRGTVMGLAARAVAAWRMWRAVSALARRFGLEFPRRRRGQEPGHVAP